MLVHAPDENVLLDFFVAVPGKDGIERRSELDPVPVYFSEDVPQIFNVGAASCGVPGTAAGLWEALRRFGSMPMAELARPAVVHAREGLVVNTEQAFIFKILEPILTHQPEGRAIYAPQGHRLREGDLFRFEELSEAVERYGVEGPEPFYRGELARAVSEWVVDRGGTLGVEDLGSYEPIARYPARGGFRGRDVLTNPPPSSGGILIAFGLDLLDRLGVVGIEQVVAVMEEAQAARTQEFHEGLREDGWLELFLDPGRLDAAAERVRSRLRPPADGVAGPGDALGSTTHITVVDGDGRCASVTCSNGTGSGLIVPGTGVHVNNMLGEQDLNPFGFHTLPAGRRMPSMMSPTVLLREGELELGLGSGGSNRIRSAVLQTIVRLVANGMEVSAAVEAPRVHFEAGAVQAEPGADPQALERLEARGYTVARWAERNLFFGGVHAVSRDPETGELRGGGDPRRGGAIAVV
jgi:gamma-glutamyltranspeptidase/glutathione hydrolase